MAAWGIRAQSRDVDLFVPDVSDATVEIVELELRGRYGEGFRLDVTRAENVWGPIIVRDIEASPVVATLAEHVPLRALRIEDLFLLKLVAARPRDVSDLDLLAPHTSVDALVLRWNQLVRWHGDRTAVLGFADGFIVQLRRLYASDPAAVIARLDVTPGQRDQLADTYGGEP